MPPFLAPMLSRFGTRVEHSLKRLVPASDAWSALKMKMKGAAFEVQLYFRKLLADVSSIGRGWERPNMASIHRGANAMLHFRDELLGSRKEFTGEMRKECPCTRGRARHHSRASNVNYASCENPTRLAVKSKVEYTFSRKLVNHHVSVVIGSRVSWKGHSRVSEDPTADTDVRADD